MRATKALAAVVAALTLFTTACTDDITDQDDPATGDPDYLDYGELMPGPDYDLYEDPTYLDLLATGDGPTNPYEQQSVDLFAQGMTESQQDIWLALPTITAEEFPGLTSAERDQMISDFQGLVALSQLMQDHPSDPTCVEVFQTNEQTGQPEWMPLCPDSQGPNVKPLWGAVVKFIAKPVGRWVVQKAAPAVANVAKVAFQKTVQAAGAAVKYVRQQLPVIKMAAYQAATWAKNKAVAGYQGIKNFYKAASQYRLVKIAKFVGTQVAQYLAFDYLSQKVFGGPTETETEEAVAELLSGGGNRQGNPDLLFDIE